MQKEKMIKNRVWFTKYCIKWKKRYRKGYYRGSSRWKGKRFNSPSLSTAQKPLPSIRHICGLSASVGCDRTFNTPRLKSQICLIGGNGFVCNFTRVCLKNHSSNLHAPIYAIFCLHSADVARYADLIQAKSPANCNAHLAESLFQTHSSELNSKKVLLYFSLFPILIKYNYIEPHRISNTAYKAAAV